MDSGQRERERVGGCSHWMAVQLTGRSTSYTLVLSLYLMICCSFCLLLFVPPNTQKQRDCYDDDDHYLKLYDDTT